ncbi:heat-shock protein [Tannerella sp. oral taxon 808]|jgi:putative heat-shock related protein|nr:heat-shock protein [Tannerella sp. oral taxon 808]PNE25867.1 heat-shock protein [Tannerella sp. oral taxon 808]PNE29309.1 heat-shock protein [Tannerella sp. oral taxon 808]
MTLTKRNQNYWLPSIFNDFLENEWMGRPGSTAPAINVKESKDAYTVEVAAPGMTKSDFNVSIDADNNLAISMEKKEEKKEEKHDARYLRREFSYAKFQQTMILPDDVDKDRITAKVENGVLLIGLPKVSREEVRRFGRNIEIG